MDINKLFSIQSNGYSIGEVDDYVAFIQTELTKNMKVNRDLQNKNDTLFDSLNQIKSDNRKLSEKNQKLYKDCVAFAKRLKALEVYDNSVEISNNIENEQLKSLEELQNAYDILLSENQELKAKLYNATYTCSNSNNEYYVVNDDTINNNSNQNSPSEEIENQEFIEDSSNNNEILETVFENTPTQENENIESNKMQNGTTEKAKEESEHRKLKQIDMDDYNESLQDDDDNEKDLKDKKVKKEKRKKDKSPQNIKSNKKRVSIKIFNFFINLLLTLSIILGVVSIITFAFVKNPDVTFVGYRSYTVLENNVDLGYNKNDIIIVKRIAPAEVRKDFRVLCKNETNASRNIKLISSVKNKDSRLNFYVKDSSKSTTESPINDSDIIGKVTSRIPGIGVISRYAFNNPYDYIAIITCVLLLCIFIKILMSLRKSKQRKIKFEDYDISDFSLDI